MKFNRSTYAPSESCTIARCLDYDVNDYQNYYLKADHEELHYISLVIELDYRILLVMLILIIVITSRGLLHPFKDKGN